LDICKLLSTTDIIQLSKWVKFLKDSNWALAKFTTFDMYILPLISMKYWAFVFFLCLCKWMLVMVMVRVRADQSKASFPFYGIAYCIRPLCYANYA
jgi:hypothetical protein